MRFRARGLVVYVEAGPDVAATVHISKSLPESMAHALAAAIAQLEVHPLHRPPEHGRAVTDSELPAVNPEEK